MKHSAEAANSWRPLYVLAAAVFIALSMHMPVSLFATASHDDALFITQANRILTGHWLGPFDQLTLAKGPAYSLFLAINALLGLPITLSIAVLYALACCVFVTVLTGCGLRRAPAIGLLLALLFQPALLPTRIIRDNIYPALTLLSIAGVISVARHQQSTVRTLLWGFILGLFWITREEGVWILPGIALYFIAILAGNSNPDGGRRRLLHFGLYILAAFIPTLAVSGMNYIKYGTFEVVDFKNGAFENAWRKLNNVMVGDEIPYLPVPRAKRELIYKISPAFGQLEDVFEGTGRDWMQPGCQIYPQTCGDYAGGWLMWALRDAVAEKGYYQSPHKAEAFYDQISTDISVACKNGTLDCRSNFLPFLPAMPRESLARIPATALKAFQVSLYRAPVPSTDGTNNGYSLGTAEDVDRMRLLLGNPRSMPAAKEGSVELTGWYHSPTDDWLALECSGEGEAKGSTITRRSSPDIAAHFNDRNASAQRFSMRVRKADDCRISLENQRVTALPVAVLLKNADPETSLGDGILYVDEKIFADESVYAEPLAVKQGLATLYRLITAPIAGVGVACYLACLVFSLVRKRAPSQLLLVASMLWVVYLCRVALIVLVDVSSFPAANYFYLAPALPILYAAAIASIASMVAGAMGFEMWRRQT